MKSNKKLKNLYPKIKIAQLAPLWIPVPPRTYGGIELILFHLIDELKRRKHQVTLFASGDSQVSCKLFPVIKKALWLEKGLKNPHAAIIKMLYNVKKTAKSFDLIHNHFNFFMFPLAFCNDLPPILTTIHLPIEPFYAEAAKSFPQIHFCSISQDAKKSAEEQSIPIIDVIPNGINLKLYAFNDKPEDYLFYLGRLNREKGIVTALDIAKKTGQKLIVAGNIVGAEEWTYFMQEIQPRLNEPNINFVGQINFNEKIKLLKNAKVLLFPIDRREPFGLAMIEAMACGTPVIGFRRGSVPEVVKDKETGFVVDTEEEMIESIKKINSINRKNCRKLVEEKFTLDIMVERYEKLYEKILAK